MRRDTRFSDNELLPGLFSNLVGDKIYDGLANGFREEVFGAPQPLPLGAPRQQVLECLRKLLEVLIKAGFAISGEVVEEDSGFRVSLFGTANLWGGCVDGVRSGGGADGVRLQRGSGGHQMCKNDVTGGMRSPLLMCCYLNIFSCLYTRKNMITGIYICKLL